MSQPWLIEGIGDRSRATIKNCDVQCDVQCEITRMLNKMIFDDVVTFNLVVALVLVKDWFQSCLLVCISNYLVTTRGWPSGHPNWRSVKLLDKFNYEFKMKTTEGQEVGVCSLAHNTSRVKRRVETPRWGLGWVTSRSIIHTDLHKPNNKLVSA